MCLRRYVRVVGHAAQQRGEPREGSSLHVCACICMYGRCMPPAGVPREGSSLHVCACICMYGRCMSPAGVPREGSSLPLAGGSCSPGRRTAPSEGRRSEVRWRQVGWLLLLGEFVGCSCPTDACARAHACRQGLRLQKRRGMRRWGVRRREGRRWWRVRLSVSVWAVRDV